MAVTEEVKVAVMKGIIPISNQTRKTLTQSRFCDPQYRPALRRISVAVAFLACCLLKSMSFAWDTPSERLYLATMQGDVEGVQWYLKRGANVNVTNIKNQTALMMACYEYSPNIEVINVLLEHGADVNAVDLEGETALIKAMIRKPRYEVIQTLLQYDAHPEPRDRLNRTPLILAVLSGSYEPFEFTIEEFTDGFTVEALCQAIAADNYDLDLKSSENTIDRLNEILNVANLYYLSLQKHKNIDLNWKITRLSGETQDYRIMPEEYRREYKENFEKVHKKVVELNRLLLQSLYPDTCPKRPNSAIPLITVLLDHGADIHARDGKGNTALMWARTRSAEDLVELLVSRGASPQDTTPEEFLSRVPEIVRKLHSATRSIRECQRSKRHDPIVCCCHATDGRVNPAFT